MRAFYCSSLSMRVMAHAGELHDTLQGTWQPDIDATRVTMNEQMALSGQDAEAMKPMVEMMLTMVGKMTMDFSQDTLVITAPNPMTGAEERQEFAYSVTHEDAEKLVLASVGDGGANKVIDVTFVGEQMLLSSPGEPAMTLNRLAGAPTR